MPHTIPKPISDITSNPLRTREDMITLLHSLLTPLLSSQSPKGARIQLGHTGTHFDTVAAEFEGFARALWGLAPILSSEPDHPLFKEFRESWVRGLDVGTNPDEEEYWGDCLARDQRFVEMAALGFSLAIAPKVFWEPLSEDAKKRLNKWLLSSNNFQFPDNNWRFFRVLINLGLKTVGGEYSQEAIDRELDFIDTFYGEHGFPSDGPNATCAAYDYYATTFAIPFYTLIYGHFQSKIDPIRVAKFRQRARENLVEVINLFGPDGHNIPFGRSLTYRFATSCFFAGLAFDGSDDYNSPQSPYWALKSFLVLALPSTHPFWTAKEEPYPKQYLERPFTVVKLWMQVFTHAAGHTFCLSSGQRVGFPMRQAAAKYGKMAYSTAFGFSVPTGAFGLQQHVPDSTLALSDDEEGERWVVRRDVGDVTISDEGVLRSSWKPWPDVEVITWLIPPPTTKSAYHTRIHKITYSSGRKIQAADSGFSIHSHAGPAGSERRLTSLKTVSEGIPGRFESPQSALAVSKAGVSGVIDLIGSGKAMVQDADGNSNLMAPRTVFPLILTDCQGHGEGTVWLGTRVYAMPFGEKGLETGGWKDGWEEEKGGMGLEKLREKYPLVA